MRPFKRATLTLYHSVVLVTRELLNLAIVRFQKRSARSLRSDIDQFQSRKLEALLRARTRFVRQLGQQSVTKDSDTSMMEFCRQVAQPKLQLGHLNQYFRVAGTSESTTMVLIPRLLEFFIFSALWFAAAKSV